MGPLQSVLWRGGGFATYRQLIDAGATSKRLKALVDGGRLLRPRRGVYALPSADPAGLRAVRLGGRLAELSAARSFGLWGGWSDSLVISLPGSASGRSLVSRGASRDAPDLVRWNDDPSETRWCWRVSAQRCILQVLRWHDRATGVAVVETALTARIVDRRSLLERLQHDPHRHDIVLRARVGAASGVESIARQRLEGCGLQMEMQSRIDGVGLVDLRVVGTRVIIELDGYRFHSSPERFADDRRRDSEARVRGFVPLRFTALQVCDQWPWVERMILAGIATAGLGPS
ncbi:hypothetical protein AS850_10290 [Frondihabitans sp. 762G35]|uniref:type IV toxin-antitoxin system AbiEi family antitoxin domain-containing protein n=1 Tax=Frondihabitans sp. 762G35 TaxID=1446794 RepID=UPI000D22C551|nr:type IV toxin-antitoxin system AbiEi family antitoxin domain-containing protein [Frondihabitans sp. 762G35]ARC57464.1 hypothetical protein AS850_10290 [Frondihabitans sp. 762G35]